MNEQKKSFSPKRGWGKVLSLLLVLTMVVGFIPVVGSTVVTAEAAVVQTPTGEGYAYETTNSDGVTITQNAIWNGAGTAGAASTVTSNGAAKINLKFEGLTNVKSELKKYNYVFLVDMSGTTIVYKVREAMKSFANKAFAEDPGTKISIIPNTGNTGYQMVYGVNLTSASAVSNAIDTYPESGYKVIADFIDSGVDYADSMIDKNRPVLYVAFTDGDFAYAIDLPVGTSFTVDYKGDTYGVKITSVPKEESVNNYHATLRDGTVFYSSEYSFAPEYTVEPYNPIIGTVTKNGIAYSNEQCITDTGANIGDLIKFLYGEYKVRGTLRQSYAKFATVYYPGIWGSSEIPAFNINVPYNIPRCQLWADDGYYFTTGTANDYAGALLEVLESARTKIVSVETTIDTRYYVFDKAAMDAEVAALGNKISYATENVTGGTKVTVTYDAALNQAKVEDLYVPVTIKSGLTSIDAAVGGIKEDGKWWLPVTVDATGDTNGSTGCSYTDINGAAKNIRTTRVFLDAAAYIGTPSYTIAMPTPGYKVLLGKWAEIKTNITNSCNIDFTVKSGDTSAPIGSITVEKAFTGVFSGLDNSKVSEYLTISNPVANGGGFRITVTPPAGSESVRSCVVKVTVKCGEAKGEYIIVVPGDTNASGEINSGDITALKKIVNSYDVEPKKLAEGGYLFELMDINGSGDINSGDVTNLKKMVNSYITSN